MMIDRSNSRKPWSRALCKMRTPSKAPVRASGILIPILTTYMHFYPSFHHLSPFKPTFPYSYMPSIPSKPIRLAPLYPPSRPPSHTHIPLSYPLKYSPPSYFSSQAHSHMRPWPSNFCCLWGITLISCIQNQKRWRVHAHKLDTKRRRDMGPSRFQKG